jgi:hypothetical protein
VKDLTKQHPNEIDIAAFAGGDLSFFRRIGLDRHLRGCESCQVRIEGFHRLRSDLIGTELGTELPHLNWSALAAEMRANIHLGIEAGECVRETPAPRLVSPRLAVAFASLLLIVGAAVFMRDYRPERSTSGIAGIRPATATPEYRIPVLETSVQGIEMRTGPSSFAFLNHEGGAVSQTVSAAGAVRSRDIDGDTGSVTIKDVYLQ